MNRGDYLKNNPDIAKKIGSVGGKNSKRGKENWFYIIKDELLHIYKTNSCKSIFNYHNLIKDLKRNHTNLPDLPKSSIEFKRKYGEAHSFKIKEIDL